MRRRGLVLGVLVVLGLAAAASPAAAHERPVPVGYDLPSPGVLLEGIGVDQHRGVFYVSGVNDGGDVYRGHLGTEQLERWYDGTGTTGRGIVVDRAGRVFVAGGPTGTVRIFTPDGSLVATLATGATGSFLNDLWIAPDGSILVTDSSLPRIWRVTHGAGGWSIGEWLDVSATVPYTSSLTDFDLGGIVTTRNGRYLLVGQGTTGQVWRIDLRTKAVREVDLGGVRVVNADGLVLRGDTLWVVQNFSRQISRFDLSHDASSARLDEVTPTPANRTFTTAKLARGRLLVVDSQFGFPAANAPAADRVVTLHP